MNHGCLRITLPALALPVASAGKEVPTSMSPQGEVMRTKISGNTISEVDTASVKAMLLGER